MFFIFLICAFCGSSHGGQCPPSRSPLQTLADSDSVRWTVRSPPHNFRHGQFCVRGGHYLEDRIGVRRTPPTSAVDNFVSASVCGRLRLGRHRRMSAGLRICPRRTTIRRGNCPFCSNFGSQSSASRYFQLLNCIVLFRCSIAIMHTNRDTLLSGNLPHCKECDKQFTTTMGLKNHIKTVHQKVRLHSCPKCSRTFSRKHHLTDHLASSERKGRCPANADVYRSNRPKYRC